MGLCEVWCQCWLRYICVSSGVVRVICGEEKKFVADELCKGVELSFVVKVVFIKVSKINSMLILMAVYIYMLT